MHNVQYLPQLHSKTIIIECYGTVALSFIYIRTSHYESKLVYTLRTITVYLAKQLALKGTF